MDDDMNTADALGAIFEMVKDANVSVTQGASKEAARSALKSLEAVCDVLGLLTKKEDALPEEIAQMVNERAEARKNKDWARSDELREMITKAGYILEDTKQGQKVRKDV
jgi:cysteinyl-tRNA synthetase